ncbi:MAG: hypothetical protein AAFQ10_10530 [Pseudomonadota bacterium]
MRIFAMQKMLFSNGFLDASLFFIEGKMRQPGKNVAAHGGWVSVASAFKN